MKTPLTNKFVKTSKHATWGEYAKAAVKHARMLEDRLHTTQETMWSLHEQRNTYREALCDVLEVLLEGGDIMPEAKDILTAALELKKEALRIYGPTAFQTKLHETDTTGILRSRS
jgi:hypothetical protein